SKAPGVNLEVLTFGFKGKEARRKDTEDGEAEVEEERAGGRVSSAQFWDRGPMTSDASFKAIAEVAEQKKQAAADTQVRKRQAAVKEMERSAKYAKLAEGARKKVEQARNHVKLAKLVKEELVGMLKAMGETPATSAKKADMEALVQQLVAESTLRGRCIPLDNFVSNMPRGPIVPPKGVAWASIKTFFRLPPGDAPSASDVSPGPSSQQLDAADSNPPHSRPSSVTSDVIDLSQDSPDASKPLTSRLPAERGNTSKAAATPRPASTRQTVLPQRKRKGTHGKHHKPRKIAGGHRRWLSSSTSSSSGSEGDVYTPSGVLVVRDVYTPSGVLGVPRVAERPRSQRTQDQVERQAALNKLLRRPVHLVRDLQAAMDIISSDPSRPFVFRGAVGDLPTWTHSLGGLRSVLPAAKTYSTVTVPTLTKAGRGALSLGEMEDRRLHNLFCYHEGIYPQEDYSLVHALHESGRYGDVDLPSRDEVRRCFGALQQTRCFLSTCARNSRFGERFETGWHHDRRDQLVLVLHCGSLDAGEGGKQFQVSHPTTRPGGEESDTTYGANDPVHACDTVVNLDLERGDLLYLPSKWRHNVVTRGATCTLNWSYDENVVDTRQDRASPEPQSVKDSPGLADTTTSQSSTSRQPGDGSKVEGILTDDEPSAPNPAADALGNSGPGDQPDAGAWHRLDWARERDQGAVGQHGDDGLLVTRMHFPGPGDISALCCVSSSRFGAGASQQREPTLITGHKGKRVTFWGGAGTGSDATESGAVDGPKVSLWQTPQLWCGEVLCVVEALERVYCLGKRGVQVLRLPDINSGTAARRGSPSAAERPPEQELRLRPPKGCGRWYRLAVAPDGMVLACSSELSEGRAQLCVYDVRGEGLPRLMWRVDTGHSRLMECLCITAAGQVATAAANKVGGNTHAEVKLWEIGPLPPRVADDDEDAAHRATAEASNPRLSPAGDGRLSPPPSPSRGGFCRAVVTGCRFAGDGYNVLALAEVDSFLLWSGDPDVGMVMDDGGRGPQKMACRIMRMPSDGTRPRKVDELGCHNRELPAAGGRKNAVWQLTALEEGRLVSMCMAGQVRVWRVSTREPLHVLDMELASGVFNLLAGGVFPRAAAPFLVAASPAELQCMSCVTTHGSQRHASGLGQRRRSTDSITWKHRLEITPRESECVIEDPVGSDEVQTTNGTTPAPASTLPPVLSVPTVPSVLPMSQGAQRLWDLPLDGRRLKDSEVPTALEKWVSTHWPQSDVGQWLSPGAEQLHQEAEGRWGRRAGEGGGRASRSDRGDVMVLEAKDGRASEEKAVYDAAGEYVRERFGAAATAGQAPAVEESPSSGARAVSPFTVSKRDARRDLRKEGQRGMRARRDVSRGEVLGVLSGGVCTREEWSAELKVSAYERALESYCMEIETYNDIARVRRREEGMNLEAARQLDLLVVVTSELRLVNCSRGPHGTESTGANCRPVEVVVRGWPVLTLVATEHIASGSEVLFDYGEDYWLQLEQVR
ncbi:hypothetical protein CYMTET_42227, partial [Cymbomonas tetramitiformis]